MKRRAVVAVALVSAACGSLAGYITFAALSERERGATEGRVRLGSNMDIEWSESKRTGAAFYQVRFGPNDECFFARDTGGEMQMASLTLSGADRQWRASRLPNQTGGCDWSWSTLYPMSAVAADSSRMVYTDSDNDGVPDSRSQESPVGGIDLRAVELRGDISWMPRNK